MFPYVTIIRTYTCCIPKKINKKKKKKEKKKKKDSVIRNTGLRQEIINSHTVGHGLDSQPIILRWYVQAINIHKFAR